MGAVDDREAEGGPMKIAALTVTKRPGMLENVRRMVEQQIRRPHCWAIIGHGDHMAEALGKLGAAYHCTVDKARSLGWCRNFGVNICGNLLGATHIAMMDDDDWYGPGYLEDVAESIEAHPWGGIYGIREYDLGFVKDRVSTCGGNIIDRRNCDGGVVLEGNRVTWVSGATVVVDWATWKKNDLHYQQPKEFTPGVAPDGSIGGEDGGLWEQCRALDIPLVRRPSTNFCAIRVISEDGWGGEHCHTWGPLQYHPPAPPGTGVEAQPTQPAQDAPGLRPIVRDVLRVILEAMDAAEGKSARTGAIEPIRIAVRRKGVAEKVTLARLVGLLEEDPKLGVGTVQIRYGGKAVETFELGGE